jgi:hypothetical protein
MKTTFILLLPAVKWYSHETIKPKINAKYGVFNYNQNGYNINFP